MKLLIAIPVFGRPELTKIILDYYASLKEKYGLELLAVGSEWEKSRAMCERAGWNYIEFPNNPLSQKCNALAMAAKAFNPDAVCFLGSDDLMSEEIIDYYIKNYSAEAEYMMGFKGCYIYDVTQKKLLHAKGYTGRYVRTKTIGAGRLFSKTVLDKIDWMPWNDKHVDKGLDTISSNFLEMKGVKEKQVSFDDTLGMLVDIKYDENITPFSRVTINYDLVPKDILRLYFDRQMQAIDNLPVVKKALISPNAIISPNAVIGHGNIIEDFVIIKENVIIGDNNFIGTGTIIGAAAEIKGNEQQLSGKVIIGNNNVIREYVSIHSPARKEVTKIGDNNYIMNKVHIGHDCEIGNHVTISALASTGGVTVINDYANMGQGAILRGRLTLGENCMIGCGAAVVCDVPAFQTWAGVPAVFKKFNIRGMEKRGFTGSHIREITESDKVTLKSN